MRMLPRGIARELYALITGTLRAALVSGLTWGNNVAAVWLRSWTVVGRCDPPRPWRCPTRPPDRRTAARLRPSSITGSCHDNVAEAAAARGGGDDGASWPCGGRPAPPPRTAPAAAWSACAPPVPAETAQLRLARRPRPTLVGFRAYHRSGITLLNTKVGGTEDRHDY